MCPKRCWDKYLGLSDRENIEAVSRDYHMGLDSAAVKRLMEEKKEVFEALAKAEPLLIDGVSTFVQRLIEHGVRRAICSGAIRSDIDLMLSGSGLADAFEVIVTADDVTHGKPNPEGYLLALEKLNKTGDSPSPAECVVVEDPLGPEAIAADAPHRNQYFTGKNWSQGGVRC